MGFWIYMLIMDLLIPTVMVLFGRAFLKKAPKEINYVFGYGTSRSMKNKDTWEFAHRYCGKIWLICGFALIPIVAGIMLCFIGADTKTVGYVGAAWENNVASLRVFMATLRKKIEATPDTPQYIQTHIGVGYRMLRVE